MFDVDKAVEQICGLTPAMMKIGAEFDPYNCRCATHRIVLQDSNVIMFNFILNKPLNSITIADSTLNKTLNGEQFRLLIGKHYDLQHWTNCFVQT